MSKEAFEKNNLGWQIAQLKQRILEWWELQFLQLNDNFPDLSWLNSKLLLSFAQIAFWSILTLLLFWVILKIIQLVSPYLYTLNSQQDRTRLENSKLLNETLSMTDWLARSQKLQQQGNYRESIFCLYQAMLQQLNDTGIIPHQASRTDGEYLRLIQNLPQPIPYQRLLVAHQQLCFSDTEASLSLFNECQQALKRILNY